MKRKEGKKEGGERRREEGRETGRKEGKRKEEKKGGEGQPGCTKSTYETLKGGAFQDNIKDKCI